MFLWSKSRATRVCSCSQCRETEISLLDTIGSSAGAAVSNELILLLLLCIAGYCCCTSASEEFRKCRAAYPTNVHRFACAASCKISVPRSRRTVESHRGPVEMSSIIAVYANDSSDFFAGLDLKNVTIRELRSGDGRTTSRDDVPMHINSKVSSLRDQQHKFYINNVSF